MWSKKYVVGLTDAMKRILTNLKLTFVATFWRKVTSAIVKNKSMDIGG